MKPVLVKDAETNNSTVKIPTSTTRNTYTKKSSPKLQKCLDPTKLIRMEKQKLKKRKKESDPQTTPKDSADQQPPKFGPRPDTSSADFNFKMELDHLPFTINISKAPVSREQQSHFIDLIYDYKKVFSLYDGDLGFCDALKHSIPTTTDKPVYLPH